MKINAFNENSNKLIIGVEKRFNDKMGRMLDYLCAKDIVRTGRVEQAADKPATSTMYARKSPPS